MLTSEPGPTAVILLIAGLLLAVCVLFSRASGRIGVPVALLFLAIGVAAGSEGIGGVAFADYTLAFRWGTLALILILFDGGLNTSRQAVRQSMLPAAALATVGVIVTAGAVAMGAVALGFAWAEALLMGAVVSSTDAAAVFSVLRGSGLQLKRRVGTTLELESGLNDPMAVSLTIALTQSLIERHGSIAIMLVSALVQLVVGGAAGLAIGFAARHLLQRVRLPAAGLYPVLTLAIALLAYAAPTLIHGSGFLSVYLASVVIGNGPMPYRTGVMRVHDALAWLSQVTMFLLLGLLIFPSQLLSVAVPGLVISLVLSFVARPLAVLLCLAPFRYPPGEIAYIGWVGLRGAVPIILALFPVLAGAAGSGRLFNLVFFVVVLNTVLTGGSIRRVTRWLRLESTEPAAPPAVLEITSMRPLTGELLAFHIDGASAVAGATISQLPFPEGAAAMLIVRQYELIAPKGPTTLQPGDHVFVFCRPEDRGFIGLMFGQPEEH